MGVLGVVAALIVTAGFVIATGFVLHRLRRRGPRPRCDPAHPARSALDVPPG